MSCAHRRAAVVLAVCMLGCAAGARGAEPGAGAAPAPAPAVAPGPAAASAPAGAAEAVAAPVIDELVVTGERAGPGLWHVHRGGAHVWILGSLSPLPKGITWRSKQVETLLAGTSQVLVAKPFDIGIARILWLFLTERDLLLAGGGRRLRDLMPPEQHARFATLRARYTDDATKWERFRPLIAAAFLQQAAFHQAGLSTRLDLGASLRMLADKRHVRIEEVKTAGMHDVLDALKTLPPAAENACVEASLVTVERGLPRLIQRAQAWANGDVELLGQLPQPAQVDACRNALDAGTGANELIALLRRAWLERIEKYLRTDGVTIAVMNLDLLLERGGLLDELRAKDYEIDAP